jgi:hypothetical protein
MCEQTGKNRRDSQIASHQNSQQAIKKGPTEIQSPLYSMCQPAGGIVQQTFNCHAAHVS